MTDEEKVKTKDPNAECCQSFLSGWFVITLNPGGSPFCLYRPTKREAWKNAARKLDGVE